MKVLLKLGLLLLIVTELFGAKYTHDDFHKELTEIDTKIEDVSNRLIKVETKIEHYDSFSQNFKDKDYTLTTIVQNISYGAYIVIPIVIAFFIWLCNFIGKSIYKLENNYNSKYNELENRYSNKFQALEEKADRIINRALNDSFSNSEETSTNSNDPF